VGARAAASTSAARCGLFGSLRTTWTPAPGTRGRIVGRPHSLQDVGGDRIGHGRRWPNAKARATVDAPAIRKALLASARVGNAKEQAMSNHRRCIVRSFPVAAALLLWGCAGPLSGIPRFPWGKPVDLHGVRFEFDSVRTASSIAGSPRRPTAEAGQFVIVKVTTTNTTDAPIAPRLWPVFRLVDSRQAMYAPSAMRIAVGGLQLPADAALSPPSMSPGVAVEQEMLFDVPVKDYLLLVIMQSGKALYRSGTVTPLNSYFILDIASQLARP
jgi:hypothetical protein